DRAILERRDQGGERPPEFCLGCHGFLPNAGFGGLFEKTFISGLAIRRKAAYRPRPRCRTGEPGGFRPRFCRGSGAKDRPIPRHFSVLSVVSADYCQVSHRLIDSPAKD